MINISTCMLWRCLINSSFQNKITSTGEITLRFFCFYVFLKVKKKHTLNVICPDLCDKNFCYHVCHLMSRLNSNEDFPGGSIHYFDILKYVIVLNFVEKNRDSEILGGKRLFPPPPWKNILTASIFCQKSIIFFFQKL